MSENASSSANGAGDAASAAMEVELSRRNAAGRPSRSRSRSARRASFETDFFNICRAGAVRITSLTPAHPSHSPARACPITLLLLTLCVLVLHDFRSRRVCNALFALLCPLACTSFATGRHSNRFCLCAAVKVEPRVARPPAGLLPPPSPPPDDTCLRAAAALLA